MHTNLEYEKANVAIQLIKTGYSVTNAVEETDSNINLINIMLNNESSIIEEVFSDDSVRVFRQNICSDCDKNVNNICMQCACPLPVIINMKFKECPLGKW
jgi:hypothetical protein